VKLHISQNKEQNSTAPKPEEYQHRQRLFHKKIRRFTVSLKKRIGKIMWASYFP